MTGKTAAAAKQQREKLLLEFQSACDDLQDEIDKPGGSNERRIKLKVGHVKSTYEDALDSHAGVITIEKTSASDEVNRNWVRSNLRQPYVKVTEAAEDKLISMGAVDDEETESRNQIAQQKSLISCELATLEARLKASVESMNGVLVDTTIWLVDNHKALSDTVEKLDDDLTKLHVEKTNALLRLLTGEEIETTSRKHLSIRNELCKKIADLKIKLAGKTPARTNVRASGQVGGIQAA